MKSSNFRWWYNIICKQEESWREVIIWSWISSLITMLILYQLYPLQSVGNVLCVLKHRSNMRQNVKRRKWSAFHFCPLRKHDYSNILKISPPKTENFQIKKSEIFLTSAQNIDCGYSLEPPRRGGSNEYPQFMFWAEIRKIMYTL